MESAAKVAYLSIGLPNLTLDRTHVLLSFSHSFRDILRSSKCNSWATYCSGESYDIMMTSCWHHTASMTSHGTFTMRYLQPSWPPPTY